MLFSDGYDFVTRIFVTRNRDYCSVQNSQTPLYPGWDPEHTRLSVTVKLLRIKALHNENDPLYLKLDKILVSLSWEQHFPLVIVKTLVRGVPDHAALFLHTGFMNDVVTWIFKFELCGLPGKNTQL